MSVRVYELAKELGIDSKALVTMLGEMGEFVRSPSSTLEAPVVRKLRAQLAAGAARQSRPPAMSARVPSDLLGEAAQIFGVPRSSLRPARSAAPRPAYSRQPAQAPMEAWRTHWIAKWFESHEVDAWLAVGLGREEYAVAASLRDLGITPDQLAVPVDGRTVGARLRGGEPVGQVVARLRQAGRLGA